MSAPLTTRIIDIRPHQDAALHAKLGRLAARAFFTEQERASAAARKQDKQNEEL